MSAVFQQSWRLADIILADLQECLGATGGMNAQALRAVEIAGHVPQRIGATSLNICFYPGTRVHLAPARRALAFGLERVRFPLDAGLLRGENFGDYGINIVSSDSRFVMESALALGFKSPLEDIEIITAIGKRNLWNTGGDNMRDNRKIAFSYDAALTFRFADDTSISVGPALKGERGIDGDFGILFREFRAEDFSHLGDRIEVRSIKT